MRGCLLASSPSPSPYATNPTFPRLPTWEPDSGMATNEDPPGQEFLLRRLQRAAAVPLGERSREVAAFIAAMQLEDQIPSLLPLTEGGEPALQQASLTTQRRVLLAHLMWVNVIHACPVRSLSVSTKAGLHLQQYASELDALAAAHSSDTAGREGSGSAADSGGSGRESSSHTSDSGNGADSPGAEPSSGEVSLAKILAMLWQAHGTAAGNDLRCIPGSKEGAHAAEGLPPSR